MRLINESVTPIGRRPRNFIGEPLVRLVGWSNLRQFLDSLEESGELLRISRPVDIELEAGCIADRVVKMGGRALLFEQPRLPDGSISEMPLAMNLFGTPERVKMALGVDEYSEIGKRLVGLMKPDVAAMAGRPWKGIPLAKQALRMAPKRVKKAACQEVVVENPDLTKLPIPRTWPLDAGHTMTLPLVVTKDAATGEQNLGMYRAQVYGPTECGLHWQMHKHGADHADAHHHNDGNASGEGDELRIPVAICLGGPPELIFSAISPLPDNLSEYMFASFLSNSRLPIVKAKTQDLWVPAEADVVIEGYAIPGETRTEGPFGDHFGIYSLEGEYPVLHVTAITHREEPVVPMTIVGLPPMEDGYIGEAIADAFLPVLNFQHRDVVDMYVPLQTGFHNLAIVATKQRYPRQARKTCLGLLGAGQLMFTKVSVAVDANHPVKDLQAFLDTVHQRVDPAHDLIVLPGMVADTLESAAPWENVHDKLLIDATTLPDADPRRGGPGLPKGTSGQFTPDWRRGEAEAPGVEVDFVAKVRGLPEVSDTLLLRPSMLVVTTKIDDRPDPRTGMMAIQEPATWAIQVEASRAQRQRVFQLMNSIWQLEGSENLRWLFITDDDVKLHSAGVNKRLLWQLFVRFDVGRDLHFDTDKKRVAWDATAPVPHPGREALAAAGQPISALDPLLPIRSWPAITIHDPAIVTRIQNQAGRDGYEQRTWAPNVTRW